MTVFQNSASDEAASLHPRALHGGPFNDDGDADLADLNTLLGLDNSAC